MITGVNTRYPGATHDSSVWKSSMAYAHLKTEYENAPEQNSKWLLGMYSITITIQNSDLHYFLTGDSGYALQPYLFTPFVNATTDEQRHFNKVHAKTRSKVERCIGVLKNRFRCLLGERTLLYSHEKCSHIIVSCVVLNNFMLKNGEHFDHEPYIVPDIPVSVTAANESHTQHASELRNALASQLFNNNNNN